MVSRKAPCQRNLRCILQVVEMKDKGFFLVCAVFLAVFIFFAIFSAKFEMLSGVLLSTYGLVGIFLLVILMDTIIQPIPPDLVMIWLCASGLDVVAASLIVGIGSCSAGILGYTIGRGIGASKFEKWFGKGHLEKGKGLFDKYGIHAVSLGAFSPIPYSSVCWTAGIYGMRLKPFFITALLTRISRFSLVGFLGSLL